MAKKIRVKLDAGAGGVLLDGADLQPEQIQAAVRARFPLEDEFVRQMRSLLVEYDDGTKRFAFRTFDESVRAVDRTVYL